MTPVRLLHVFATFAAAGPQIRVCRLIRGLGDAFRHTIIAADGRTDAESLLDADLAAIAPPPNPAGFRGYRRLLREAPPDLLLTYNWGSFDAVLAARSLRGVRHVHHEDGFNRDEAERQKSRRVWARRLALRGCDRVVVCSENLLGIARDTWRLPPERTVFIPNGIDGSRFADGDRAAARATFDISPDAAVIGAVGHLRPVKNFVRLLEAAHRVDRPVDVLLVGDGPERPALEELARTRPPTGGKVIFAGHLAELADVYAAMDVFCLSSDSEQHPVALLEAMAAGVPAVATDVGDVATVLGPDARSRVVRLGGEDDEAVLATALEQTLAVGEAEREALTGDQKRRVENHYSFDQMVETYRSLYGAVRREA